MSLKHAILGFLSVRPMSGYDLKKAFDESVGHFWSADQAQIYRTLAALTDEGLVEVRTIEQRGKPDRREHRLTPDGEQELDAWLRSSEPARPMREPFLLRVFFAGRLDVEEVRRMLLHHVENEQRRLETLRGIAATLERSLRGRRIGLAQRLRIATLDNGIAHTKAELEWARTLLADLATP